jgi:hypothetical protein
MNDQARVALSRILHTYGPSICQMPHSAELFVRKECSPYPNESRVLVEALRHGVTTELASYNPADKPWEAFSTDLGQRLQKRAGLNEVEGTWAVDAWARALGRHPEAWADAPVVTAPAEPTMSMGAIKFIMLAIASGGGAAGGALGAVILPAALLLTTTAREISMFQSVLGGVSRQDIWKIITIALLVISAIGAVGGGLGAAIGWWHGRGDRNPWSAALAAFGGAFISAAITGRFLGIFGWFFGSLFGAFGAARTAASRGGYG